MLACPLQPNWPDRLKTTFHLFQFSSPEEEAFLRTAHETTRGAKLADINAEWEIASDDQSGTAPSSESHFFPGNPCHLHMEFEVYDQHVHIDRIWGNLGGPGRLIEEIHIFVDGHLVGFGSGFSTSLGFGGGFQPAVALLKNNTAIVVTWPSPRGIDLQAALATPFLVQLYAVMKKGKRKKTSSIVL